MLIGWEGQETEEILSLLEDFRPAGFVFFKRNYPGSPQKLREQIAEVNLRAAKLLKRKLLWALDQEGGTVTRLFLPETTLPSAGEMGALAAREGLGALEGLCYRVGLALRELGFNFNLAPVLDVRAEDGSYIGSRSFSADPQECARAGAAFARGFSRAGLLCCGKHFPGLGPSMLDPHLDLPVVSQNVQVHYDRDGLPFRELIAQGIPAVMTTHVLHRALDGVLPATFSEGILALLKKDYGFKGLVLTDDLEMGALSGIFNADQSAVEAVKAGHDLVLVCRRRENIQKARDGLARAIAEFAISPRRSREAQLRLTRALKFGEGRRGAASP
jgi:beta-N-acetylhexosaminidase